MMGHWLCYVGFDMNFPERETVFLLEYLRGYCYIASTGQGARKRLSENKTSRERNRAKSGMQVIRYIP